MLPRSSPLMIYQKISIKTCMCRYKKDGVWINVLKHRQGCRMVAVCSLIGRNAGWCRYLRLLCVNHLRIFYLRVLDFKYGPKIKIKYCLKFKYCLNFKYYQKLKYCLNFKCCLNFRYCPKFTYCLNFKYLPHQRVFTLLACIHLIRVYLPDLRVFTWWACLGGSRASCKSRQQQRKRGTWHESPSAPSSSVRLGSPRPIPLYPGP